MFTRSGTTAMQLTFVLLQLADVITTMIALGTGGIEQNPIVSRFMALGSLQGLILAKVVMLAMATAAIRFGKYRAIRWANLVYAGIVLWNISVIVRMALQSRLT
jgi:Domain of unknown function (DUF5658)